MLISLIVVAHIAYLCQNILHIPYIYTIYQFVSYTSITLKSFKVKPMLNKNLTKPKPLNSLQM